MNSVFPLQERSVAALLRLYHAHGYAPYRISKFEEYGLYAENRDFLLSKDVLSFTDTDGRLMALKPDVTLSLVKNTRPTDLDVPRKVYYSENVYRVTDRSAGFREIPQVGLECIGPLSDTDRCEVVLLAAESLAALGDDWILDLSDMGLVCGQLDELGLEGELRAEVLECVRNRNLHGMEACLSGRRTADLSRLLALAELYGPAAEVLPRLKTLIGNDAMAAAAARLEQTVSVLPSRQVHIDLSVMYDTNYYGGVVFQGFLRGLPARVLSGGCYDELLRKMGRSGSAVGFAVYPDLLWELDAPAPYDADLLLLTGDAAPARCLAAAQKLIDRGYTVRLAHDRPGSGRFGRILTVEEAEADA